MLPLMYLFMKIKHHISFIIQYKVLKNILIYYYYQVLKILIIFHLKILIDLWLIKQNITVKTFFFDIAYIGFLGQEY